MRWINCKKCGHKYSSQLGRCPECSAVTINFKLISSIVLSVSVLGIVILGIVLGLTDNGTNKIDVSSKDSSQVSKAETTSKTDSVIQKENSSEESSSKFDINSILNDIQSSSSNNSSQKENNSSVYNASKESNSEKTQASYKYKIGTEMLGDMYYITMPEYFLRYLYKLSGLENSGKAFEDFAYTLTDEDKQAGFTKIYKNSDGSATKAITINKYNAYITDYTKNILEYIFKLKKSDFITDINHNNLQNISINLSKNKESVTVNEYAEIILLGCLGAEKQLSTVNTSGECNINLTFSNGETEILRFPESLKY